MAELGALHRRRLREVWRSAGWPCQDGVEIELLAAGWLERVRDAEGRETLRVTDAGVQVLAAMLQKNRAARDAHEALVARVAAEMQRAGRVVWRGLSLRAPLAGAEAGETRWVMAMPDVYSIRHTTVEDYAEPVAHEIKVRRADLLSDLRRPDKGAAYLALASQCWYVLREASPNRTRSPKAMACCWRAKEASKWRGRRRSGRCGCRFRSGWRWRAPTPSRRPATRHRGCWAAPEQGWPRVRRIPRGVGLIYSCLRHWRVVDSKCLMQFAFARLARRLHGADIRRRPVQSPGSQGCRS